jgi:hypothetical protein
LTDKRAAQEQFFLRLCNRGKGLARYLLRNGSLLSIEVEPKLVDVLVFRSFSGEYIYATLSESAEHLLLKAWDAS